MSIALKITNLEKSYGNVKVIKKISFEVEEGEVFGLLGANGAGKSTTLECIEGIKKYNFGKIEIFGVDITTSKDFHKIIGVQLQSTSLPKNITVEEAMKFYCKWQKRDIRNDLLERFGMKLLLNKQYGTLSTGQKRRLHLALAISNNPRLLILDEPTAGLDVQGRFELHREIKLLKEKGVTIILASHDMAEVEMLCDRIAIVVKGEIKFIGTEEEITTQGDNSKRIKVKTKNKQLLETKQFKHSEIEEVKNGYITLVSSNIETSLSEILELTAKLNDKIIDLNIEGLSLEEKFVEVVSHESKVN